jgi:AcrR family transcriptional regulator
MPEADTLPPRSRLRETRERDILQAAVAAFAAKGYAGARMEDIAAAAGIGKGTLYVYFPSKQALLEGVVRAAAEPSMASIEAIAVQSNPNPAESIRVIVNRAKRALNAPLAPLFAQVLVFESGQFPEIRRIYRKEVTKPILDLIAEIIAQGVESGAFRPIDPHLAARLLISPAIASVFSLQIYGPNEAGFDPDALLDTHVDLFLAGLAADKAPAV